MKHILSPLIALLLLSAAPVYAAESMNELPADHRIKLLTYDKTDVYTIPTKYGYQTSIVFASGEEINTVSVGERSMWQIIPTGNRIFIRPMHDDLSTNMTVITNMREYNFDIQSVAEGKTTNLYVVQFRYPEPKIDVPVLPPAINTGDPVRLVDEGHAPTMPAPGRRVEPINEGPVTIPPLDTQRTQVMNHEYTYTGPDALAPAHVYDDGLSTFIVYTTLPTPAPKPYITSTTGKTVVPAHRLEGNRLVISSVASQFSLRSTGGEIMVYNEQFNSSK